MLNKFHRKMLGIGAAFLMLFMAVLPASAAAMHDIQQGDSLYKIAKNNGITIDELKQANGLRGDLIYAGDELTIPDKSQATAPVSLRTGDTDLLARLITAEAGAEPFEGKVAVAAVILNRIQDVKFPATVAGNIFKPHEFESVSNGLIWEQPTEDAYKAAVDAVKGWDPTYGAKYFYNPAKVQGPSWVWSRTVVGRIGNHVFAV
ncbi:MAG: cell wall hydrolase [Bacillota bacterium]